MIKEQSINVLGEELQECSTSPMTGFFRDGCCHTNDQDRGLHTVCAIMTDDFLQFSKAAGNDLSTSRPEYNFPGLKAGDRWCLCALRFKEAHKARSAPQVVLESTHVRTLDAVSLEILKLYAADIH